MLALGFLLASAGTAPSSSGLAAQTAPIRVPFRTADSAIIVDAKVNGRPVSLMFDSGFSGHIKLGEHVNVGPASGTMTLRDFVGEFQAKTVKLNLLELGAEKLSPPDGEIVQMGGDYTESYGMRCDGILGLAPFTQGPMEINFERKEFVFYPKSFDIRTKTPDNKKSFLVKMLPAGNDSIELRVETGSGERMNLALDTGNGFYATTHKDVLERIKLWQPGVAPSFQRFSFVASGPVASWDIMMKDLTIFGVPVEQSVWNIIDLPSSSAESDGTVGYGFLKNFNVIVDLPRRHVWLENFSGKTADEHQADLGMMSYYDRNSKRIVIWNVIPNSPAEQAGVKRGDQVIGVNGRDVSTLGWRQINDLMRGAPDSEVLVDLSRGGSLQRMTLKRELLVNRTL